VCPRGKETPPRGRRFTGGRSASGGHLGHLRGQRLLARGKSLADAKRSLSEVTDWIAKLSAAEQAAPSCYAEKGATLRARFTTVATAGCRPLVRPNYAYFNAALPRSTPQVLIITGIKRCFDTADKYNNEANSPSPSGCRANRALVETMDKDAIRAWLR